MFDQYRVIIAGGRYFSDYELLKEKCDEFLQDKTGEEIVIISGHVLEADSLDERYAQERGFKIETYPADWKSMVGLLVLFAMNRWLTLPMP